LAVKLKLYRKGKIMEHTKGKWEQNGTLITNGTMCSTSAFIATCPTGNRISYGEAEANARLIAASPMLLEACKMTLRLLCGDSCQEINEKPIDIIKQAIAKAEN